MCIGFWTLDHPIYSLILCSNRDEFIQRPTLNAAWHDFSFNAPPSNKQDGFVLSGADPLGGGTWLGMNRAGKVAFLTNVAESHIEPHTVSRGALVASFLKSDSSISDARGGLSAKAYAHHLVNLGSSERPVDVGGFNLIVFEPKHASDIPAANNAGPMNSPTSVQASGSKQYYHGFHVSNSGSNTVVRAHSLEDSHLDGFAACAVSNAVDGSDVDAMGLRDPWTKVSHGKELFEEIVDRHPSMSTDGGQNEANGLHTGDEAEAEDLTLVEDLMGLLGTVTPNVVTMQDLRRSIFITPHKFESGFGDSHIQYWYGTQLSTVILVRKPSLEDGRFKVTFVERDRTKLLESVGGGPEPVILSSDEGRREQRVFRFDV